MLAYFRGILPRFSTKFFENALRGTCPVCGKKSEFTGFTENARESGSCSSCGSFNRQRQMAYAIRRLCGIRKSGEFRFAPGFSIYNTETSGQLHHALSASENYVCSEYFGEEYAPGQDVQGIRHENLQKLSFADRSFDLVLSSDVLEHMPDPYAAHREIFRVLKPGGRHIFTVPYNPGACEDDVRARIVDGQIEYLAEKLYHGDPVRPDEGILVWTIFGSGMLDKLRELGFSVSAMHIHNARHGIIGEGAIVFDAMKPA